MRIASVQFGNFTLARRVLAAGGAETYNGQRYTVEAFERFVDGVPHMVVSLNAPPHREMVGDGEYLAVAPPQPHLWVPRRFKEKELAARVIPELQRFDPTHLLLRCNDIVGAQVLEWAIEHGVRTAAIIAAVFQRNHPPCMRFCQLANHPLVDFIANHNRVATASLVECGLPAAKAVMWDYPPQGLSPDRFGTKTINPAGPVNLLFAGSLIESKGITDLVRACAMARRRGRVVRVVVCGAGPKRKWVLDHAGAGEGWLESLGEVSHDEVVRRMIASDLVVVPSRHSFPEALPCVIQEALAVRTPLLLSDHPVFLQYFKEGQAARFFAASDPKSLAGVIEAVASDAAGYALLSGQTAEVWNSVQIETKFHHLLDDLRLRWGIEAAQ